MTMYNEDEDLFCRTMHQEYRYCRSVTRDLGEGRVEEIRGVYCWQLGRENLSEDFYMGAYQGLAKMSERA